MTEGFVIAKSEATRQSAVCFPDRKGRSLIPCFAGTGATLAIPRGHDVTELKADRFTLLCGHWRNPCKKTQGQERLAMTGDITPDWAEQKLCSPKEKAGFRT